MEVILILWLLMGLIAGMIAASKGRSGMGFGCLGFLLGPIGILIAAVVSPDARQKPHRAENGIYRNCPECAEPIRAEAIKCRFCGVAVDAIDAEPRTYPTQRPPTVLERLWWMPNDRP